MGCRWAAARPVAWACRWRRPACSTWRRRRMAPRWPSPGRRPSAPRGRFICGNTAGRNFEPIGRLGDGLRRVSRGRVTNKRRRWLISAATCSPPGKTPSANGTGDLRGPIQLARRGLPPGPGRPPAVACRTRTAWPRSRRLSAAGGKLFLAWADDRTAAKTGNTVEVYARTWSGTAFIEEVRGDASFRGVSQNAIAATTPALAVDPSRPAVRRLGRHRIRKSRRCASRQLLHRRHDLLRQRRLQSSAIALPPRIGAGRQRRQDAGHADALGAGGPRRLRAQSRRCHSGGCRQRTAGASPSARATTAFSDSRFAESSERDSGALSVNGATGVTVRTLESQRWRERRPVGSQPHAQRRHHRRRCGHLGRIVAATGPRSRSPVRSPWPAQCRQRRRVRHESYQRRHRRHRVSHRAQL